MTTNNILNLDHKTQFFEFEDAKIAFDFYPAKETPQKLLLLINGYQRTRLDFRALRKRLENLAPNVATLALDNRGSGQTLELNGKNPLSIDRMARDAWELTKIYKDKLNINSVCALGISVGGMIAQRIAVKETSLKQLFLVSTTAGGITRVWSKHKDSSERFVYKKQKQDLASIQENMTHYFAPRFLNKSPLLFELLCKTMQKYSEDDFFSNRAERQYYASAEFDNINELSKINANTVIFSGDTDDIIPIENSYYLKEHILNSQLVIYPETGHLILIEEADKFAEDLAKFLTL